MGHRFVIMLNNQLVEYDRYEDIPDDFDHVIEFLPDIPPEPHTHEQHEEIDSWHDRFLRLMRIENASSSKTR
jgi:hypothetical protein